MNIATYLFWPNPPTSSYDNPKIVLLLLVCGALVVGSFAVRHWRKRQRNSVTRKLTRSWPSVLFWFGLAGAFFVVCRVEGISYFSMRFLWVLWGIGLLIFALIQLKIFHMRHYEIVPQQTQVGDPREKYLPKRKRH